MAIPQQETVTLTGASGKQYVAVDVYPRYSSWNSVAGVYLILRKLASGRYDTLYVGETDDLAERIANHHKMSCFEQHGWTHLAFLSEGNARTRLIIEADILRGYRWPCNG